MIVIDWLATPVTFNNGFLCMLAFAFGVACAKFAR